MTVAACSGGSGSSSSSSPPSSAASNETAGAVKGGTLNMLGTGDVDYMDPNISYYTIGYQNLRMWSRQLFTNPDTAGKVTTVAPDIATQLPTAGNGGISADGLTYTIKMRPDVKWNTTPARAVTAADVVRGVKRTCNPVQPFGGIPDFQTLIVGYKTFCDGFAKAGKTPAAMGKYIESTNLPGVVAKGKDTVVFKLTHPATYFLGMLTMPAFSPAPKEYDAYVPASSELNKHLLSDGPYQVESYTPTKQIVYTRNPAWVASSDPIRKAYVDKIIVNETLTQDSIQQQLKTGTASADMEFDAGPPPSQIPALVAQKDPNLTLGATSSTNPYVLFNTASPNNGSAMGKVAVRQALSYAINRANLIQVLGGPSRNKSLTHVLPSTIVGGKQNFDLYPYDVSKAKQMLSTAGEAKMKVKILYRNASEASSKAFQTLQQDLSKAGIKAVGVPSPNADFYTKYLQVPSAAKRGVWDIAIAGWGPDWFGNAALSFFNPLFSGKPSFPPIGSNFGMYNDPTTNKLIDQAIKAKSESQAASLWAKADHQVMKDAAFFPITDPLNVNYHAPQVHNTVYLPAIQNYDPTNVWLSKDKQGG
jgi:peptide/nickel transport system substrate-binding protein